MLFEHYFGNATLRNLTDFGLVNYWETQGVQYQLIYRYTISLFRQKLHRKRFDTGITGITRVLSNSMSLFYLAIAHYILQMW